MFIMLISTMICLVRWKSFMNILLIKSERWFILNIFHLLAIEEWYFSLYKVSECTSLTYLYTFTIDRFVRRNIYKYIHLFRHLYYNHTHYIVACPSIVYARETNELKGNMAHYLCSTTAFITSHLFPFAHSTAAPAKILSFRIHIFFFFFVLVFLVMLMKHIRK